MTHSARQTFSPKLLSDYAGLKHYLHGEEDLTAIQTRANQSQPEENSAWDTRTICRICLNHTLGSSLVLISPLTYLLNAIGLRYIHSFCDVASAHLTKEFGDYLNSCLFTGPILVPARNKAKLDSFHIYTCPDVSANQITDSRVLTRTQGQVAIGSGIDLYQYGFHLKILFICLCRGYILQIPVVCLRAASSLVQATARFILEKGCGYIADHRNFRQIFDQLKKNYSWALEEESVESYCDFVEDFHVQLPMPNPVRIYKGEGVCRGASEYFIHLCLQSRKWFSNPEEWLKAVSSQFKEGVPGQGVLMQAFFDIPSCFFGYSVTGLTGLENHLLSSAELDTRSATAIQKIETLSSGVYLADVYKHGLVYIKLDSGASYTWDPECGLLKHTAEELFDHVIRYYHKKGEQNSQMTFRRYRLFHWF